MKKIKVWDGATRLYHWTLVTAFAVSAYSAFQDKFDIFAELHLYAGTTVLILSVWRLVWGFLGSDTVRFGHFLASPRAVVSHLRGFFSGKPYTSIGHNPLGGYFVLVMIVLLIAQPLFGLFASDDMFFEGPFAAAVSEQLSNRLTDLHETTGLIAIGLVALHILAIIVYTVVKRVNLVRPMITGSTDRADGTPTPTMRSQGLALGLFLAVGTGVCLIIF